MLNIKKELARDIKEALGRAFDIDDAEIVVERVENRELGDYASPVALSLSKRLGEEPLDIVAKISEAMPKKEYIGKLEGAEPGFLNIRLNVGWLQARLDDVVGQDVCDGIDMGQGQSFNFEFISANPTGPLTIGNIRTAFSIDTLANVLSCAGYNITREYYVNDAGGQVAKLGESIIRRALQAAGEKVEYPEEMYQGDYVIEVAAEVVEALKENEGKELTRQDLEDDETIYGMGERAAKILLANIKKAIKNDLKIEFDVWSSETVVRKSGEIEKTLEAVKKTGKTYKKDGALYLKTTEYGDSDDRVLVKSDGEYAYIMPDIAYHRDKYERGYDHIFTVVGADHQGHAPKLYAAMEILGYDKNKLNVVAAQWMRFLKDGKFVKLSKRAGNISTPKDLIDEVGYDAARYFMIQHALTTHLDFDLDLAKEKSERNPVYYVQYAYVRLQSILRKAKEEGLISQIGEGVPLTSSANLTDTTEINLMKQMYRLPEVVTDIAESYEVQQLTSYVYELARNIHAFYHHVPVILADSEELAQHRLQLIVGAKTVLGKALDLLGVSKPDVM